MWGPVASSDGPIWSKSPCSKPDLIVCETRVDQTGLFCSILGLNRSIWVRQPYCGCSADSNACCIRFHQGSQGHCRWGVRIPFYRRGLDWLSLWFLQIPESEFSILYFWSGWHSEKGLKSIHLPRAIWSDKPNLSQNTSPMSHYVEALL